MGGDPQMLHAMPHLCKDVAARPRCRRCASLSASLLMCKPAGSAARPRAVSLDSLNT